MTASRLLGRRRRGEPAPSSPRDVVLVMRPDTPASAAAIAATRELAGSGSVTVVLPLRIHGYALGLPNPGLLPTARERGAAEDAITATVRQLRRSGIDVDGQIVVTRHAHRAVTAVVQRRGARSVLVDQDTATRARRLVEGNLVRQVARRVGPDVVVSSALGE